MRTHEGKTRYMSPIYKPKRAVAEGQEAGFTYGVLPDRIPFRALPGKGNGKAFRYHGLSERLRDFFNKLYWDDQRERERLRREQRAMYDTISIAPVGQPGKHRLREDNQWPTQPQTLMAEAAH